jgi:hypothetical protein
MTLMFSRRAACFLAAILLAGITNTPAGDAAQADEPAGEAVEFPDAPLGNLGNQVMRDIAPGVEYQRFDTDDPLRIHVLTVDLAMEGTRITTCLAQDSVIGTETVHSMAHHKDADAAVNGDYWSPNGVPQGLCVIDGKLAIAPKHRAAFAIDKDGVPHIGIWTEDWSWETEAVSPTGERRWIRLLNSDCNEDWLCLYNDLWTMKSRGDTVSPVTELVVDETMTVTDLRIDKPGVTVPKGGYVLTGRGESGDWLAQNFRLGDPLRIDTKTDQPIDNIQWAVGAGPIILKDGEVVQDPIADAPDGEEFTLEWKRMHYLERQPRTAVGISQDKKKVIFVVVDGRQPWWSIGVYQHQMARLLQQFGAWDGMDLDSGGSSTMIVKDRLMNRPSDEAKEGDVGGVQRPVANAILIYGPRESK